MGLTTATAELTPTNQLQLKVSEITILSQKVVMGINLICCDDKAMSLGKGGDTISHARAISRCGIDDRYHFILKVIIFKDCITGRGRQTSSRENGKCRRLERRWGNDIHR